MGWEIIVSHLKGLSRFSSPQRTIARARINVDRPAPYLTLYYAGIYWRLTWQGGGGKGGTYFANLELESQFHFENQDNSFLGIQGVRTTSHTGNVLKKREKNTFLNNNNFSGASETPIGEQCWPRLILELSKLLWRKTFTFEQFCLYPWSRVVDEALLR